MDSAKFDIGDHVIYSRPRSRRRKITGRVRKVRIKPGFILYFIQPDAPFPEASVDRVHESEVRLFDLSHAPTLEAWLKSP